MTARQNFCRCPNSEDTQINPWLSRLRSARLVDWLALCQRHKSIGVSGSVSSKIFAVIGPAIIPRGVFFVGAEQLQTLALDFARAFRHGHILNVA